ncbi:hypothetical protein AB3D22_002780 [Vibrio alginolyticus]
MDNLTFIVELTKSLAWPVSAVIIATTFKKPLSELLSQLENMKVQGAEFKFGKVVKEIIEEEQSKSTGKSSVDVPSHLVRLADISPRGALLEAWIEVEESLIEARTRCAIRKNSNLDDDAKIPPSFSMNLISSFYKRGIVTEDTLDLYRKLRAVRNEVVHSRKLRLSADEVYDFLELSMQLKLQFDSAQR